MNLGMLAGIAFVGAASMLSCSATQIQTGTVMAVITSDMTDARVIDAMGIDVLNADTGATILSFPPARIGTPPTQFPATQAFSNDSGSPKPIRIRLVGYKATVPVVLRQVSVVAPTQGTVRVDLPLLWINRDKVSSPDGTPEHIVSDCGEASSNIDGVCQPDKAPEPLQSYLNLPGVEGREFNDGGGAGVCFAGDDCFASAVEVTPDANCSIALPANFDEANFNIAIKVGAGAAQSLVVLSHGGNESSWAVQGGRIQASKALCTRLSGSGKASIVVANACPSKPAWLLPCGQGTSYGTRADAPTTSKVKL